MPFKWMNAGGKELRLDWSETIWPSLWFALALCIRSTALYVSLSVNVLAYAVYYRHHMALRFPDLPFWVFCFFVSFSMPGVLVLLQKFLLPMFLPRVVPEVKSHPKDDSHLRLG